MATSTDAIVSEVEAALLQEARKIKETMGLDSVAIVVTGTHTEDDGDHTFWGCARSGNAHAVAESIRLYRRSL